MLPAVHRMRRSTDFADAVKRGRRAGRKRLVVHVHDGMNHSVNPPSSDDVRDRAATPALVGLVVSKAVGNAVVRHQVSRRLRHVMRERLVSLHAGSRVVIRANPAAATATSAELAADLDAALRRLLPRA